MAQLEEIFSRSKGWIHENRRELFWLISGLLLLWLIIAVQEVAALLIASYFIALLIEPMVSWFESKRISRELGVIIVGILIVFVLALLLILIIPAVAEQSAALSLQLPGYLTSILERLNELAKQYNLERLRADAATMERVRSWASTFGLEQLKNVANGASTAILSGYSFTLMALNLTLIPFFVFYISADIEKFHRKVSLTFAPETAEKLGAIAKEILSHIYAFFRGQLTVAAAMAGLYALFLSLVGLPSALAVGVISGALSVVPYLGTAVGILLATLITLVTDPHWSQLFLVWGAFGLVQFIEGTFLTPKILGDKMGIHPLGVMLSLIIGAQLFGLLGIVLAIPGAAALRVLFHHLHQEATD